MQAGRTRKIFSLTLVIPTILAGTLISTILFFFFWQKFNQKVEVILRDQFNQQQLMLARKIADNVETYFDIDHHGTVMVGSIFGRGSTFTVKLPQKG